MAEPCRCAAPNSECHRSGMPMIGRRWELCHGVRCTPEESARHRTIWDSGKPAAPVEQARVPCCHLGEELRRVPCVRCRGGKVALKVFACAIHHETTLGKKLDGIACCVGCPGYSPAAPTSTPEPEAK